MNSNKRKRSYSVQQALELIVNDSDSEGIAFENDSDVPSDDLSEDQSEYSMGNRSSRSNITISNRNSESADSVDSVNNQPRQNPLPRESPQRLGAQHPRQYHDINTDSSDSDSDDRPPPNPPVRGRQRARGRGRGRGRGHDRGRGRGRIGQDERQDNNHIQANQADQRHDGFAWDWYDTVDPYTSEWLPNFSGRRGILVDTTGYNPVDYFYLFYPNEAFNLMSTETNRYAAQYLERNVENLSTHSRFRQWKPTDIAEMKAFTALQLCMGMCQKNELEDYWSKFWLTSTAFREIMPRNRYELLTSFLHFTNNEEPRPRRDSPHYDPLWKIRPLMDICEPTYMHINLLHFNY